MTLHKEYIIACVANAILYDSHNTYCDKLINIMFINRLSMTFSESLYVFI